MLERAINKAIADFYHNHNGALLFTGARQTGKTYAIRHLGKSFAHFIEINFVEQPQAIEAFKET